MTDATRLFCLRVALVVVGLFSLLAFYPLLVLWPSGWAWGHGHSHYALMMVSIYATLGVFLLIAARDPLAHRSLIWFTVWSSVAHGGIMAAQALNDSAERGHLFGDVPALFLVAAVLAFLTPRLRAARTS
jgi:hypothetical protein